MGQGHGKRKKTRSELGVMDDRAVKKILKKLNGRFTNQEIRMFYYLYLQEINSEEGRERVTRDILNTRFADIGGQLIKDVILAVIDQDGNGIDFIEFLSLLGLLTRGSSDEIAQFVFALYDWQRNNLVSKKEVLGIVDSLSWFIKDRILVSSGLMSSEDISDSEEDLRIEATTKHEDDNQKGKEKINGTEGGDKEGIHKSNLPQTDFPELHEKNNPEYVTVEVPETQARPGDFLVDGRLYRIERVLHHSNTSHESKRSPLTRVDTDLDRSSEHGQPREDGEQTMDKEQKEAAFRKMVDDLFGNDESIDWQEFKKRQNNKNPFYKGFGIVDYFRTTFFSPLEKQVQQDILTPPSKQGYLIKRTPGLWRSRDIIGKHRKVWVTLRSGFLFVYGRKPKDGEDTQPHRAIPLNNASAFIRDEFKHHRIHRPHWTKKKKSKRNKEKKEINNEKILTESDGEPKLAESKPATEAETEEEGIIVASDLVPGLSRLEAEIFHAKGIGLNGMACFFLDAGGGHYRRYFLAKTLKERLEWLYAITANSAQIPNNRFHSFAPVRKGACRWFVDGASTFSFIADAVETARSEIFIAGWWVCPDLLLKRGPDVPNEMDYRLDNLLKRKAEEGVSIHVIVWNESMPMALNSAYTKKRLEALHPNITVMRHPHTIPVYWSHHQKIVVVDQDIAFIGGLDLCFGRWDTSDHHCFDTDPEHSLWPGKDYFNESMKVVADANLPDVDIMDRMKEPRQPWHDIHCVLDGHAARDAARLFIQRWNHHLVDLGSNASHLFPKSISPLHKLTKNGVESFEGISIFKKVLSKINLNTGDESEETKQVSPFFTLLNSIGIAAPADQNANKAIKDKEKKSKEKIHGSASSNSQNLNVSKSSKSISSSSSKEKIMNRGGLLDPNSFSSSCEIQIVRSMSTWSGALQTETSIHEAYVHYIKNAERFIYIENQYFISTLNSKSKNKIGSTIFKRISRAIRSGQAFRVVIVMPSFPTGGSWVDTVSIQYVMKWQYDTICRGGSSIIERLKKRHPNINVEDYITFHALRSYGKIGENQVTEQVYVHSKLLIVDDRVAIIGSANINERSMNGDRDSEVCAIITDNQKVRSKMNGEPWEARKFAHELRKRLWREHLGLANNDDKVRDPLVSSIYHDLWLSTAKRNTEIFDDNFDNIPKNATKRFKDVKGNEKMDHVKTNDTSKEKESPLDLTQVKGHLILFSLHFLEEESLTPGLLSAENLVSVEVFK